MDSHHFHLASVRFAIKKNGLSTLGPSALAIFALTYLPAAATEYGVTTKETVFNSRVLPPGNYVPLEGEDGEVWVTKNGERLPKSSVRPLRRIGYAPPIDGVVRKRTPVFKYLPDLTDDNSTLHQPQMDSLSHRVMTLREGEHLRIYSGQGSDYMVMLQNGLAARVPVSAVDIVPGQSFEQRTLPLRVSHGPPNKQLADKSPLTAKSLTPDTNNSNYFLLFAAAAIAACLAGAALFAFRVIRGRETTATPNQLPLDSTPSTLESEINRRFPPDQIYRVPQVLITGRSHLFRRPDGTMPPLFEEHLHEFWSQMLSYYPHPPNNDREREQREASFWKRYALICSGNGSTGEAFLLPKQKIVDYFRVWEKWIFRDFYAATGVVHRTICEECVRHIVDLELAKEKQVYSDEERSRKHQAIEKARDAEDRFQRETYPAHIEKWGGWFFFHIQEAFRRQHGTDADYGPQSATGPANHSGHDDLSYNPNA